MSRTRDVRLFFACAALAAVVVAPRVAASGAVEGGAVPQPLPLFPPTNWWNLDISAAPVDPSSAAFISFLNNGGTRRLHPDFGGDVSPGSVDVYGMPYVVVDGTQPKVAVEFLYSDESDGVDHARNQSFPFYPIPVEAITQPHWVEGGAAGSVDQRDSQDRHLLILDRDNKLLYELYNVWFDGSAWRAGSGAFFDMTTNNRRPEGWTSSDAAGLAIVPGLVRYDEVFNAYGTNIADIGHAFRVTVRSTNGFVFPASHRAGSTSGALPMGARLRLKAGKDISGFAPEMQKIFRATKRYGLIVADNGSDLYVTGTYDVNWNNDILNPAFAALTASDFEVVQLGWNPSPAPARLSSLSISPGTVVGGNSAAGTVGLDSPAPSGGALVTLAASGPVSVPGSVTVPAGATTAGFSISTSVVTVPLPGTVTAGFDGDSRQAALTVSPAAAPASLVSLSLSPSTVPAGSASTGTIALSGKAGGSGAIVAISSSNRLAAAVPSNVTVSPGATSAKFTVSTKLQGKATISATYAGVTKTAVLTVTNKRR
ncbi:MAG: hypothetical protein ACRD16_03025 [Thermoanaerobaculia bacterium]